ncbi:hypothetical protein KVR01_008378 [Diaporthe batatas]|uniref:uncharacterized protein n=1 Tax=Diaporthe batatas TaxID=748121 RepID=UPI001D035E72|nr:uncharacterized protein KVR01_008378 [Diaporthe batatas]KAG8161391.1 hypothetical protein KVR01_008378 [Diaporthe batatas]
MEPIEVKFGHLFIDGEDQYLLIKTIGSGADAIAQLVLHVQTGELVVRKVGNVLLNEDQIHREDPERVLFALQSQARERGVQPSISHLQSADEVPTPQKREGQELLYHRVKYYDYYNGGTLEDFWHACTTKNLPPPPSLILTMVRDLSQALDFMYSMKPFVIHGDLHWGNIFLHWNDKDISAGPRFVLGDFGRSTWGRARAGARFGLVMDIRRVWLDVCDFLDFLDFEPGAGLLRRVWLDVSDLLDFEPGGGLQRELKQFLEKIIEPELNRLAHGSASHLPDLTRLLDLLSTAPAANPPDMGHFMVTRESQSTLSPLLYDTHLEAQTARGIHGPWHVGEVSINRSTSKLSVINVSPDTFHRPHLTSEGYETDSEHECANMV